jgi:hypothetical protein
MTSTSRRNMLKSLVAGGALAGTVPAAAQTPHGLAHTPRGIAHATVVFGQWNTPMDRFTGAFTPANVGHHVSPHEVTIGVNGSVAFLIGGFHLVLIYNPGKDHGDVDTTDLIPGVPGVSPPLIKDLDNLLYRGLDPRTAGVDRIEVVHFHEPGRYLMACGVLPHFHEMYGYIKVVGK